MRRSKILAVARRAFVEDGFAAVSMSTIAARLGGSKGTLYNYFESKEVLFAAVVRQRCDQNITIMFEDADPEADKTIEAVLRSFAKRYTHLVLSDDSISFTRMIIAESSRRPELGAIFYEAGPRRSRARLAAYLQDQMDLGRLCPVDADLLAQQFCDLCVSGLYTKRLMNLAPPPDEIQLRAEVEAALAFLSAALELSPGSRLPL